MSDRPEVPTLHRPSPSELERLYLHDRQPTLLTGMMDDWPALRRWTPEFLKTSNGGDPVAALVDLPSTGVTMPGGQDAYRREMRFGDFIDLMISTPPERPCYLAYSRATDILPSLAGDYDFAALFGGRLFADSDTRLWIGSAGTRSMLHSDLKDNLFGQVYGRKSVMLIPFAESHLLYPFRDNLVNSRVDPDEPDLASFPRYRRAHRMSFVMEPGDLLYMPKGCWHYIRSLEPSISINHWFGPPLVFRDYLPLLARLGPSYWLTTARDFVRYGLFKKEYRVDFFFSPPPTGKRLFDLVSRGDFSSESDPVKDDQ